jgi:hypothetical protein
MRFNVRQWSPVEVDFLKANWLVLDLGQLSIHLDRKNVTIKNYAKKLGLQPGIEPPKDLRMPDKYRSKSGKRDDLGIAVRSPWEANILRWLTHVGKPWQYEPKTFYFRGEKRGATSYTPDIYLPDEDLYLEIKGYLDSKGRSKIKKFKKHYPEEFKRLQAIPGTNRCQAAQWFSQFGIQAFAFYNVVRYDYALRLNNWEHDAVTEKWASSTRKRKRPDTEPLPLADSTAGNAKRKVKR